LRECERKWWFASIMAEVKGDAHADREGGIEQIKLVIRVACEEVRDSGLDAVLEKRALCLGVG
jgi:hypothetical protein